MSELNSWYKTWWGILILILFWPFSLTYYLWKRQWNKGVKIALIVVLWAFVILIFSIGGNSKSQRAFQEGFDSGKDFTTQTTTSPEPVAVKAETLTAVVASPSSSPLPSITPSPLPSPSPKQDSTLDKLWKSADKVFSNRKGVDINYNPELKTVILTFGDKDSSFWNEQAIVEGLFGVFVEYGKEVFQLDGVDTLEVSVKSVFTDSYGKEGLEDAVTMDMDKEEFFKYHWEQLKFQPIYQQMKRSSSALYIHPAILKKITLSDLKLKY